jgi:hypothetical protein
MDMVDILGSLLRHKTSQGGKGGDALNDIFRRGSQRPPGGSQRSPGGSQRSPGGSQRSPSGSQPIDIGRKAKELEELLNVAKDRQSASPTSPSAAPPSVPTGRQQPGGEQQALILIRAMINAAKADGRLDQHEQESILKQLRNPTAENIQFLREEFQRPLDARGFALSVPVGMEQQVYTMSLIAINLDTGEEATYLMELAENLRLPADVREQIHQRLGAPSIY